MNDIEQKALALVNGTFLETRYSDWSQVPQGHLSRALCRAIEQHEAFRQEVSDAVVHCHACSDPEMWRRIKFELDRFIIPAPKPDPLVGACNALGWDFGVAEELRAALDKLGFEIREKNDD